MIKRFKISAIIFTLMFFAFSAHAEVHNSDIILNTSPRFPNPNQNVKASVSTYATDLNKANISWSINGKESAVGVGKKDFTFTMGNVGESLSLEAKIETVEGQSINKNILLTPAEVDMLWEGYDSYTPPFYRGKTLVPEEGTFKVVAMPNLTTTYGHMNPENLSYIWKQDDNGQPQASGWGKNYYTFKNSYLDKNNKIEVTASDITGATNATGNLTLYTANPEILFYENNPNLGINYSSVINNGFNINKKGETFVVEPYFFEPRDLSSPNLQFDWSINDTQTATPTPKNFLSIKPDPNQSGSAKINISINNAKTLFQSLTKELNVNF
ncbi:MAG: hypothetical protein NTW62_02225 [Candidatus Nomurabacteria bacterium]|nr:hypothetical protein [Candidatus Nomurabacteria bacterium]